MKSKIGNFRLNALSNFLGHIEAGIKRRNGKDNRRYACWKQIHVRRLLEQRQIGWKNFILGRLVKQLDHIAFQNADLMTPGKCQHFLKIWKPVLKYIEELWRTRGSYVDRQRLHQEEQSLYDQIAEALRRDFSHLPIIDRRLFEEENIPKHNSSPAHKKCWLFSVECAYEKQSYMTDHNQNTLFDHGFAIYDPV